MSMIKARGILEKGYGLSPKLVMVDKRLTIEAKAIYAYMASYAGAGMTAFPSVNRQCEELGITEKRYYKHRNLLVEYGYITIEKRRKATESGKQTRDNNLYILENTVSDFLYSQNDYIEESKETCGVSLYSQNDSVQTDSVQRDSVHSDSVQMCGSNNNKSINNNSNINKVNIRERYNINYIERVKDYFESNTGITLTERNLEWLLKVYNEDPNKIAEKIEEFNARGGEKFSYFVTLVLNG